MRNREQRTVECVGVQPNREPSPGPGWLSRLLDGPHPWGSFEATVGRYGVRRYRLIVYPPGISAADRRLARLWRGWPISGATLMLLVVMLFGNAAASPETVLTVAVASYVSVGVLLFLRAGPLCVPVRSMSILLMPKTADVLEQGRYTQSRTLVDMLTRADRMLASCAVSPIEHEAIWREAYDRVDAIAHV